MAMSADMLSQKERAAVFALLGEARELSNPELYERVGFRLDGKERRKLNELGLVTSHMPGRSYVHELSDAGWRWCADEFRAGPRPGAPYLERGLYVAFAGFGRYLQRHGLSLADVFGSGSAEAPTAEADVEARVLAGYRVLASKPGAFVKLSLLLGELADVPRAAAGTVLGKMYQARQINLIPQSNQLTLTAQDRESALRIGGEDKHLISIEPR
jgi:hypothetical protein